MTNSFKFIRPVLILIVLAGLFSASCKKVNYHQLTDADMTWLVYKNNQIDQFTNTTTLTTARYLVTIRTKSYEDKGDVANEFTTASFRYLEDTTAINYKDSEGLLYIYKTDTDGLLVTFSWPHFPIQGFPLSNMLPTTGTIDGVNYLDLYILDGTTFANARYYIRKVWYSKSVGVIQYEDINGDVWVKNI